LCSAFVVCTCVYNSEPILRARRAQRQLAKFRILKIFLRLQLPLVRQRFACFRTANLARGSRVAIRAHQIHEALGVGGRAGDASRRGATDAKGGAFAARRVAVRCQQRWKVDGFGRISCVPLRLFSMNRDGYEIAVRQACYGGVTESGKHHTGEAWDAFRARVLAAVQALADKHDIEADQITEACESRATVASQPTAAVVAIPSARRDDCEAQSSTPGRQRMSAGDTSNSKETTSLSEELVKSTDRSCIVVGLTLAEHEVKTAVAGCFLNNGATAKNLIGDDRKPGRFDYQSQCGLLYCLGVIGKITLKDLTTAGEVRNIAAHQKRPIIFKDPAIAEACASLVTPTRCPLPDGILPHLELLHQKMNFEGELKLSYVFSILAIGSVLPVEVERWNADRKSPPKWLI
jgi:hypothetical protein